MSPGDDPMLRELLGELLPERGPHPGLDALAEYLRGGLDETAAERIQQHLVACPACTAELLDLELFVTDAQRPAELPADADDANSGASSGADADADALDAADAAGQDEPEPSDRSSASPRSWDELESGPGSERRADPADGAEDSAGTGSAPPVTSGDGAGSKRIGAPRVPRELLVEASWRALVERLRAGRLLARARRRGRLLAAAAVLALATIPITMLLQWPARSSPGDGRDQGLRAIINPPMVFLEPGRRGPGRPVTRVQPGNDDPLLILVLAPDELRPFPQYEVRVLGRSGDGASTRTAWTGSGLRLSDHGTVRLVLPARLLPPGRYTIELRGERPPAGPRSPDRRLVGSYSLLVEATRTVTTPSATEVTPR